MQVPVPRGGNRITILRDTSGDGVPDSQGVFLDGLNSPFGVVLVGDRLYVANTDAIMSYPYRHGAEPHRRAGYQADRPARRAN